MKDFLRIFVTVYFWKEDNKKIVLLLLICRCDIDVFQYTFSYWQIVMRSTASIASNIKPSRYFV